VFWARTTPERADVRARRCHLPPSLCPAHTSYRHHQSVCLSLLNVSINVNFSIHALFAQPPGLLGALLLCVNSREPPNLLRRHGLGRV